MKTSKAETKIRDQCGRELIIETGRQRVTANIAGPGRTSAIEGDSSQFRSQHSRRNLAEIAKAVPTKHF